MLFRSGSGVFGKTGTKTVVIFARKREECPKLYIHVKNRVDSWFAGNYEKDTIFEDTNYMESYCKFMGYDYLAYKQLLENKFTEEIVNDMWEEYEDLFEKQTEINKLKRNDTFKKKKKEQQKEELLRLKVSFIKHIEKEKLKTYILARNNRKVLVDRKSVV